MFELQKNIYYLSYDIKTNLEVIKMKRVCAKLDLKTLQKIQIELNESVKEAEERFTIPKIIDAVKTFDTKVIAKILIKTIQNVTTLTEYEILEIFDFYKALEFVLELLEKSMPTGEVKKASKFEDEEIDDDIDWDFDYMFHLWSNVMQRADDPWRLTPQTYFKQLKYFEEMNSKKSGNKDIVEEV